MADRLFALLTEAGINIDLVSTSEVRLNVIVAATVYLESASRASTSASVVAHEHINRQPPEPIKS